MQKQSSVAIIGGGFCGAMLAVNLVRHATSPLQVYLIERSGNFGRGVAYSTKDLNHLLNVPASNMSAYPDEPANFVNWLKENGHDGDEKKYYPRKVFGDYIEGQLNAVGKKVTRITASVTDLEVDNEQAHLLLSNGESLTADAAILALGNLPPIITDTQRALFQLNDKILHNPWSQFDKLQNIQKDSKVLIIGTGLTMVDLAISLFEKGHKGKITAISRHGLLPQPHVKEKPKYSFALPAERSVLSLTKFLRAEIGKAQVEKFPWQSVFDELRPVTTKLWRELPIKEKRRFMRHLRAWWDTRRHRMSGEIYSKFKHEVLQGRLSIKAGRICHINPLENKFEVAFKPRGSRAPLIIENFDNIINCAAPESDLEESKDKLIQSLLAKDIIRSGTLRMGLKADEKGAVIGIGDYASPYIFSLGSLCKGELWETVAVPELRSQADKLAKHIIDNLESREASRRGAGI